VLRGVPEPPTFEKRSVHDTNTYLQLQNFFHELLLLVDHKASAVWLPRNNIVQTFAFQLAENVVKLHGEVLSRCRQTIQTHIPELWIVLSYVCVIAIGIPIDIALARHCLYV
jgi:hypothetical protein